MILILFILQTTVFSLLQFASVAPNLLLVLTVSNGFMRGKKEGLWTGFFCGLLIDLFYGQLFGFNALIYMYLGYGSGFLYRVYFDEDIKVPLILITISDFFYGFVVYVCGFLLRGRVNFSGYLMSVIIPEIVYTVVIGIILYRILYVINRHLSVRENEGKGTLWLKD